jgi:hypothetical protein
MPDISYEALAGAALVIVLAVGYQYLPKAEDGQRSSSGKSKKKNKKKVKDEESTAVQAIDNVKEKTKEVGKKAKIARPPVDPAPTPAPIKPESPSVEVAEGGERKPKTLAQKIAPKNRKSKVDE